LAVRVGLLITTLAEVTERSRGAGEGEAGGVGRLRLAELDDVEPETDLVFLDRRSEVELVTDIGRVRRGSG
jgi:hypothetical protein